jgi:hypothetical protein
MTNFIDKHRHWGQHIAIVLMLGLGGANWLPIGELGHRITNAVMIGLVTGAILVNYWMHLTGPLCEDCIKSMPLDGNEVAARRKPVLKAFHKVNEGHGRWGYFILLTGLAFLTYAFKEYSAPYNVVNSALSFVIATAWWAVLVHRRLQPWCPFCHWDDGGEKEPSPDPIVPETV